VELGADVGGVVYDIGWYDVGESLSDEIRLMRWLIPLLSPIYSLETCNGNLFISSLSLACS
jgi:hypothetical protein